MAKKKAPTAPRFESVGWGFYVVLMLVLCIPSIFGAWQISRDQTSWYGRVGIGVVGAAAIAGILTWLLNSALQYRVERLKKAQRRKGGKRK